MRFTFTKRTEIALAIVALIILLGAATMTNPRLDINWSALGNATLSGRTGNVFGDSITMAGSPLGCYRCIIQNDTGNNLTSYANAGDQLLDQVQHAFANPPAVPGQYGYMLIGQNEASAETGLLYYPWITSGGNTVPSGWWWTGSLRAVYLWNLALGFQAANGSTVNGSGSTASCSSGWSAASITPSNLNGYALTTSTVGATCTFKVNGTAIYPLIYNTINMSPTVSYTVDGGTPIAAVQSQVGWYTALGTGRPTSCNVNGTAYTGIAACTTPYADLIDGLLPAMHTVTVTYTGGTSPLTLIGMFGNGGQHTTANPPTFFGAYPYQDGGTVGSNYEILMASIKTVGEQLQSAGFNFAIADVRGACFINGNTPNCNHYDGTHPTAADALIIAHAFEAEMQVFGNAGMHGGAARAGAYGLAGQGIGLQGLGDLCGAFPGATVCGVNGAIVPAGAAFVGTNSNARFVAPNCGANTVVAGPSTGSSGANPTCRSLVAADLPGAATTWTNVNGTQAAAGKIIAFNHSQTSSSDAVTFPGSFAFSNTTYFCSFGIIGTTPASLPSYLIGNTTTFALYGASGTNYSVLCAGQ